MVWLARLTLNECEDERAHEVHENNMAIEKQLNNYINTSGETQLAQTFQLSKAPFWDIKDCWLFIQVSMVKCMEMAAL